MISYYELLGMIKEGKEPDKIRVHLTSNPKIYKKDDDIEEYCYYVLDNKDEENDDYKYYLMDSYIESMMFDKTIEILGEKKMPEKIEEKEIEISMAIGEQVCANKINEIIDYLKNKGE